MFWKEVDESMRSFSNSYYSLFQYLLLSPKANYFCKLRFTNQLLQQFGISCTLHCLLQTENQTRHLNIHKLIFLSIFQETISFLYTNTSTTKWYLQYHPSPFVSHPKTTWDRRRCAYSPPQSAGAVTCRPGWCSKTFSWTPSSCARPRLCKPSLLCREFCIRSGRLGGYSFQRQKVPWWRSTGQGGTSRWPCAGFLSALEVE